MMRIDQIWLSTELLDMLAGADTCLARVVQVFGQAKPHCAYLFANKRGNRMKVSEHQQAIIAVDYGMTRKALHVKTHAALVVYTLQALNPDYEQIVSVLVVYCYIQFLRYRCCTCHYRIESIQRVLWKQSVHVDRLWAIEVSCIMINRK